ncbi:MAG: ABC transporter permease [Gemmatimonadota bacterium]|nr:ABC transporter permease [Gemmatimonadota bacterium]
MRQPGGGVAAGRWGFLAALPMLGLLAIPLIALASASAPADIAAGAQSPLFGPALWLSARTTVASLVIVLVTGTPLAWWMANRTSRRTRVVELLVDLPIVIPPAVMGIALLQTFGRQGLLGPAMSVLGVQVPFTTAAVVVAQTVVSAPFYVQAAAAAFRRVDEDLLIVARTLGQSPTGAFFRVAVPMALPGLVVGAALSWARALGEFGATLFFAGNFIGSTQTMPLAIYTALESDTRVAVALALVLAAASGLLLVPLRTLPSVLARRFGGAPAPRERTVAVAPPPPPNRGR